MDKNERRYNMNTQLGTIKALSWELIEMMDDVKLKADLDILTEQDFLHFLREFREKNSLLIKGLDEILEFYAEK